MTGLEVLVILLCLAFVALLLDLAETFGPSTPESEPA